MNKYHAAFIWLCVTVASIGCYFMFTIRLSVIMEPPCHIINENEQERIYICFKP